MAAPDPANIQEMVQGMEADVAAVINSSVHSWLSHNQCLFLFERNEQLALSSIRPGPRPRVPGLFLYEDSYSWDDVNQPGRKNCASGRFPDGNHVKFTEAKRRLGNGQVFARRTHHSRERFYDLALVQYLAMVEEEEDSSDDEEEQDDSYQSDSEYLPSDDESSSYNTGKIISLRSRTIPPKRGPSIECPDFKSMKEAKATKALDDIPCVLWMLGGMILGGINSEETFLADETIDALVGISRGSNSNKKTSFDETTGCAQPFRVVTKEEKRFAKKFNIHDLSNGLPPHLKVKRAHFVSKDGTPTPVLWMLGAINDEETFLADEVQQISLVFPGAYRKVFAELKTVNALNENTSFDETTGCAQAFRVVNCLADAHKSADNILQRLSCPSSKLNDAALQIVAKFFFDPSSESLEAQMVEYLGILKANSLDIKKTNVMIGVAAEEFLELRPSFILPQRLTLMIKGGNL